MERPASRIPCVDDCEASIDEAMLRPRRSARTGYVAVMEPRVTIRRRAWRDWDCVTDKEDR